MKTDEVRLAGFEGAAPRREPWATTLGLFSNPFFLCGVDLLLGVSAYVLAWLIRMHVPFPLTRDLLPQERWDVVNHLWGVLIASQAFFLYIFGLYDDLRSQRYREVIGHLVTACFGQVVLVTSVFYLTNGIFPRTVILVFGLLNLSLLSIWRTYAKSCLKLVRRVLILGENYQSASDIAREISRKSRMGLHVVGIVTGDGGSAPTTAADVPVLGTLQDASSIVAEHNVDEIVFASEPSWKDRVLDSIGRVQLQHPVRIAIQPSVYEIAIGRLRHVNLHDTPLIEIRRNPNEPLARLVKRSFDLVFSTVGLLLVLPVGVVIAAVIVVTSGRPVFYAQERIGIGGRKFKLIKFRTMVPDAEGSEEERLAQPDDPRITRCGTLLRRFRLDEIPQFLNVLKGDMSFVGPRPERPGFVKQFSSTLPGYAERHKVKPGMTGLAQVRGYYDTAAENKLRYDLAYIYNYSFSLDLLIILETIKVILVRRGS
ncbi:MAG: sugar transferase [Acidobacteriota bacterium]